MIPWRLAAVRGFSRTTDLKPIEPDAPSTSAIAPPVKQSRAYALYPDYVSSQFPEQMAKLNALISEADIKRKQEFNPHKYDKILHLFQKKVVRPNCMLIPVGSSVNGLTNRHSDLDLIFFPTDKKHREQFYRDFHWSVDFRETFMNVLVGLIQRALREEGVELVSKAIFHRLRLPLLTLELNNGVKLDIQFASFPHSIRNTHLIKMYSSLDERFQQLFIWVRSLFDALEVRDSPNGLLSTYHILLLTIHFLQSEQSLSPWPVLPVLCKTNPEVVGPSVRIEQVLEDLKPSNTPKIEWKSNNKMSVAELAVRFIDYYYHLNTNSHGIFIDRGVTQKRKQIISKIDEAQLLLIDPYSSTTVCRSRFALAALKSAVSFIRKKIKIGQMIDTFPTFPEARLFKEETKWDNWRVHAAETRVFNLSKTEMKPDVYEDKE